MKRGIHPENWLAAEHFTLEGRTLVISKVASSEIEEGKSKLVVYFRNESKGLVLNETNRKIIERNTGQGEPESWIGYSITPYRTEILMRGEITPCIRVKQLVGTVAFKENN